MLDTSTHNAVDCWRSLKFEQWRIFFLTRIFLRGRGKYVFLLFIIWVKFKKTTAGSAETGGNVQQCYDILQCYFLLQWINKSKMYGHSKKSACTLITLAYCLDLPSSLSNTILPIVSCTVLTPTFDGSVLSFSYLVIQAVECCSSSNWFWIRTDCHYRMIPTSNSTLISSNPLPMIDTRLPPL